MVGKLVFLNGMLYRRSLTLAEVERIGKVVGAKGAGAPGLARPGPSYSSTPAAALRTPFLSGLCGVNFPALFRDSPVISRAALTRKGDHETR